MTTGHPRLSPDVRASITRDGLVLLDVRGGVVLASNEIGARIWLLLEDGRDDAAIARAIADAYDVSLDRATRDVSAFIAALAGRGVLLEGS